MDEAETRCLCNNKPRREMTLGMLYDVGVWRVGMMLGYGTVDYVSYRAFAWEDYVYMAFQVLSFGAYSRFKVVESTRENYYFIS